MIAASLFFAPSEAGAEERGRHTYGKEETRILSLINAYRVENGLSPLLLSDAVSVAAEKHNLDLAKYGYTGHETRESDYYPEGARSWDRMAAEGYPEEGSHGENLAYGQDTPREAMEDWKKSEGHNENVLDERWRVVGISLVESRDGDHDHYWATDFGSEVDESAHEVGAGLAAPAEEGTAPPSEATLVASEGPASSAEPGQDTPANEDDACGSIEVSDLPSPLDEDFDEALGEAVEEKVSCELNEKLVLEGETTGPADR